MRFKDTLPAIYILVLVAGLLTAGLTWGGCQGPYVVPPPDPVDPWVPPVPPDPVDPTPDPNGIGRAAWDALAIGASTQETRDALGEPRKISIVDGVTVWVYPLAEPAGAVGEVRFTGDVVSHKTIW
jgi:hypothetical protein